MADAICICDSSIIIDLLRGILQSTQWYMSVGEQIIAVTPIVWMEVVRGTHNKPELTKTMQFLERFRIELPVASDHIWAMRQFAHYHLSHKIGLEDVMIASVAMRLQVPVYTLNLKHFNLLPDIRAIRPY